MHQQFGAQLLALPRANTCQAGIPKLPAHRVSRRCTSPAWGFRARRFMPRARKKAAKGQRGTELALSGTHVATSSYAKPGGVGWQMWALDASRWF